MTRAARLLLLLGSLITLGAWVAGTAIADVSVSPSKSFGAPPGLREQAITLKTLFDQGKFADAHALCQQGFAAATDDETRGFYLRYDGEAYMCEYSPQCVEVLKQVVEQFGHTIQVSWAKLDLGEIYTQEALMGPPEEPAAKALSALDGFVREYPGHEKIARVLWLRGRCSERLGNHEAALADYQEAVNLDPKQANADLCMQRTFEVQVQLHRWDDAIASAQRYIELFPGRRPVEVGMVKVLAHACKGGLPQALKEFEQLITQYPNLVSRCAEAWENLVDLTPDSETCEASVGFCQKLLDQYPEGEPAAFAKLGIGCGLMREGNRDEAAQWLERVLAEHPTGKPSLDAHYQLGCGLRDSNPEEAIPHLREVVGGETDPRRLARALFNLGMCYTHLKDYDNARSAYSELLSRKGSDEYRILQAGAHTNIGFTYYLEGRYDEARAELNLVVSRWGTTYSAGLARQWLGDIDAKQVL